ncbi:MAG: MazG family protein [Micromonosporaceae bacterium]
MPERIVLLVTSPRLPAGLLTAEAWDLVRSAPVYAAADSPQAGALRTAGVEVRVIGGEPATAADTLLGDAAPTVVWLAGPDGDAAIARRVGLTLAAEPGRAELELVYGSWDPPGARLLDVVAVMDRLRSPGGCPWDAEQTHESLAHYLLEEAYEAYDEMVRGDLAALREELGDVLLQVAFHARLAEELPDEARWSIDEVAGDLVEKLVRRHPHVFADVDVDGAEHVAANWEEIKKAEKSRTSAMDGVALSQPALALATKLLSRSRKAGAEVELPAPPDDPIRDEKALGAALLALVAAAQQAGLDAEGALRQATLAYADAVRAAELPSRPQP